MARSMLSFGMLFALASATAARRRGLPTTSPPPMRAATVISLRMRVKTLPRFASAAPFLCLMVDHLLWPDIGGCSLDWGRDYTRRARGSAPDTSVGRGAGRAAARPYNYLPPAVVMLACANFGVIPISRSRLC